MANKLTLTIGGIAIAGASIFGANSVCLDNNGITIFPAEEMALNEINEGKIVKKGKICFETKEDYGAVKEDRISSYKNKTKEERILYFLDDEGQLLDDILTHEIKKRGTIQVEKLKEGEDIFLKIISALNF